jgi:hypothetical protein
MLFSDNIEILRKYFFSKKNKIVYEISESSEKILFFNMDS